MQRLFLHTLQGIIIQLWKRTVFRFVEIAQRGFTCPFLAVSFHFIPLNLIPNSSLPLTQHHSFSFSYYLSLSVSLLTMRSSAFSKQICHLVLLLLLLFVCCVVGVVLRTRQNSTNNCCYCCCFFHVNYLRSIDKWPKCASLLLLLLSVIVCYCCCSLWATVNFQFKFQFVCLFLFGSPSDAAVV